MSLTKLSLAGNNLIIPDQGEFGKWHPAGDGKMANLFLQSSLLYVKEAWYPGGEKGDET